MIPIHRGRPLFRALALTLAAMLGVAGCASQTRILRQEEKVAKIRVESDPPGALVLHGERSLGTTPTDAEVRYTTRTREIKPGDHRLGWLALIGGLATLAAGVAVMVLGASMSDSDPGSSSVGPVLGYTFGGLLIATGLLAAPTGGVIIGMTDSKVRIEEAVPSSLDLALRFPGSRDTHKLRVSGKGRGIPPFDKLEKVRFDGATGTWQVPSLPAKLKVSSKLAPHIGAVSTKPHVPQPVERKGKRVIVAVFDVQDKGAGLEPGLVTRLSDYLAMRLAAVPRFKIVPRDQLKARLAKQKKSSYKSCYAQSCQIEIGKELAAQKTLATTVMSLGSRCTVSTVLYDLKSAASEGGASAAGGCSEDAIVRSLEAVVKKLAKAR